MIMADLSAIFGVVWAARFELVRGMIDALASGLRSTEADRGIRWAAGGRSRVGASVAVLPIYGMLDKRQSLMMDVFGGTSTDSLSATFAQLVADPQIKGIVLDIDSPGGTATGAPVLARQIYDARDRKPIVAVSNSEMDSAAYWIGSAAHRVYVSPDSQTGNIGVWSAAADESKALADAGVNVHVWRADGSPHKAELSGYEPFTAEAVAHEQSVVDSIYMEFASAVAMHRGTTAAKVRSDYGKGRSFDARGAVSAGLADGVATLDMVLQRMQSGRMTLGTLLDPKASADVIGEIDWSAENETARRMSAHRRRGI